MDVRIAQGAPRQALFPSMHGRPDAKAEARAQDAAVDAAVAAVDAVRPPWEMDGEAQREVLEKTLEVVDLLAPDRHLKYEIIDEAGLVQVQVIDTNDGNIVRKIPADEIVELVKQIHKTLSDRLDVTA